MVVAGSAWIAWSSVSVPRPDQELRLGRRPEVVEAGRGRGALDGGDVDVGGQVLPPDMEVRVVVDAMAEVGAERAVATSDRVVQLGGRVAVVDEQERRRAPGRRRPGDPRVECEADLGALAVGERDAFGFEARGQRRRRRSASTSHERAVVASRPGPRAGGRRAGRLDASGSASRTSLARTTPRRRRVRRRAPSRTDADARPSSGARRCASSRRGSTSIGW